MKRVSVILLVCMMLLAVPAQAQELGVDLSSLTLDELVQLRLRIDESIISRTATMTGNKISMGRYVVGVDIIPGKYDITCTDCIVFSDPRDSWKEGMLVFVFNDVESANEGDAMELSGPLKPGQSCYLSLKEGMTFTIRGGSGIISPKKFTWVP